MFGRKVLLQVGLYGIAISLLLNWFAASRFNFLGYYIYYIHAFILGLAPPSPIINTAVFAYCGKAFR